MGKLIYSMATSLDGYVSDSDGNFGWGMPEQEVHEFVNEQFRSVGTYLYGRRMYETMVYWETAHTEPDQDPFILDYARVWQGTDKIVYSSTLSEVSSERTRIERTFDPDEVRRLKSRVRPGPHGRRAPPGGTRDPGWSGRRVPALRRAGDRRRRQPVLPQGRRRRSRAAGRASIRQRSGLPAVRVKHQAVSVRPGR